MSSSSELQIGSSETTLQEWHLARRGTTMNDLLHWTSIHVGRRRFITRALATTFGLFAGLRVGVPEVLAAACCSGPMGQGWCGNLLCSGHECISQTQYYTCEYAP